ncbi:MAG: ComEC/Rec2 family competence protein [Candidatus Omnitrophica bacterium]|nr:ComEC/Rec2 family competence protein [Candidatus Omnitrophota bacterium]
MRVPFFWISLGFVTGVFLCEFVHVSMWWLFLMSLSFIPFLWVLRGKRFFLPIFMISLCLLGFVRGKMFSWASDPPVESFAGLTRVSLEGIVVSPPEVKSQGKKKTVSFVLDSKNIVRKISGRKEFFKVTGRVQVFLFQPEEIPDFADRLRIYGHLDYPYPVTNPGGFDYGHYLKQRGIQVVLKAYGRSSSRRIASANPWNALRLLHSARRKIAVRLNGLFSPEHASVFRALILGDRKQLDPQIRDDFIKTGTAHLLAISGLHIILLSGSFYLALMALGCDQKLSAFLSLGVILFYAAIAGWGIPVQRAGWMGGLSFLALLLERERNSLNTFFMAFFFLVFIDPKNLFHWSFHLSFLSVFSLILFLRREFETWRWSEAVMNTLAVLAGTFPVVICYFHIFSPISLAANFIAIPVFHLALLGAFLSLGLGFLPWIGSFLTGFSSTCIQFVLFWIHQCAGLEWGYAYLPSPSSFQIGLYYFGLGLLVAGYGFRFKAKKEGDFLPGFRKPLKMITNRWGLSFLWSFWLCVLVGFFYPRPAPLFSGTLFSAGKNQILHLQFEDSNHWLVNAGRGFPSDQGQWILAPYLREKGIKTLTGVVLTDLMKKHTGGLATILRNFSIQYLIYPEGLDSIFRNVLPYEMQREVNRATIRPGEVIRFEKDEKIRAVHFQGNQMFYLLEVKGWRFLVIPNLDEAPRFGERDFTTLDRIDVLVMPPLRGSDQKVFEEMIDVFQPKVILTPESDESLSRIAVGSGSFFFDTKTYGAVTLTLDKNVRADKRVPLRIESFLKGLLAQDLI